MPRSMRLPLATAMMLVALSASAAWADEDYANPDRPGIADGSNVVGKGRFQIEQGFQDSLSDTGGVHDRLINLPTLLRLGLTDRLEARFETNGYAWDRSSDPVSGVSHASGLSPVSLGFKYHLQEG